MSFSTTISQNWIRTLMRVTLFVRENCSTCSQVRQWLSGLAEEFPHELFIIDIDSDPVLAQKHAGAVPAVEVGPYRLESPFSETELRVTWQQHCREGMNTPRSRKSSKITR